MSSKIENRILKLASRKCGLSYRAACNISIETAKAMVDAGCLYLSDNGKKRGRFIFRPTNPLASKEKDND